MKYVVFVIVLTLSASASGGAKVLRSIGTHAASHGEMLKLKSALYMGLNVDETDEEGNSLLCLAAYNGKLDIILELLERGAYI